MEELDGVDGYNDGEDGVRDEFYDSHEDDKDKYKRFWNRFGMNKKLVTKYVFCLFK